MPLSIVDIMNFTNYFSVLSQKKPLSFRKRDYAQKKDY